MHGIPPVHLDSWINVYLMGMLVLGNAPSPTLLPILSRLLTASSLVSYAPRTFAALPQRVFLPLPS